MLIKGVEDLNRLYNDSEARLHDLFAEQRSNLLLVHGNHYTRRGSRFWNQIRRTQNLTKPQKIRITKNHLQKITKTYINSILTYAPAVGIRPKNESEAQDRKAAELHRSVWEDCKDKKDVRGLTRKLVKDFVEIGELFLKVFYDPNLGDFQGYEPVLDEETGLPQVDESTGLPVAKPIFSGDLVFERIHGFNLLSDFDAYEWEASSWCCYRKMVNIKDLKAQFKDDPEKLKHITESSKQVYRVFNAHNGTYGEGRNLCMVREYYFRPCAKYPKGYYYITTESGILFEGELPLGIFPIIYRGFDEVSTSARSYSIIKQLRPGQAEINRMSSKLTEHQVTIGDDKIITQEGASISQGGVVHGIKHVKVSGPPPTVMQGRTGAQYLEPLLAEISSLYQIAGVAEDREKMTAQLDPYALLFRSMREKKTFTIYSDKIESFLKEWCFISLKLMKGFAPLDKVIPAIGRNEIVNIQEFKSADDLGYQIVLESITEDVETKMGRQLTLNHVLQYVGNNLDPQDVGKIIRSMPYVNKEELFSDLTIDYDNANNDILALDRGEFPEPREHDKHEYLISRLVHRTKQPDFRTLHPKIQESYNIKIQMHQQLFAEQQQRALAAKADYIPTGGARVKVDVYVQPDPNKKPERATLPVESLEWLIERIEAQGTTQLALQQMEPEAALDTAEMMQLQPDQAQLQQLQ